MLEDLAEEGIPEAELGGPPEGDPGREPSRWRDELAPWIAVIGGGSLGASARYAVGTFVNTRWHSGFPSPTLLINLTGSFALGLLLTSLTERHPDRPSFRLFAATGFLGAYTTFSTFSYETVQLIQHGHVARALSYVAVSVLGGLIAIILGVETAAKL